MDSGAGRHLHVPLQRKPTVMHGQTVRIFVTMTLGLTGSACGPSGQLVQQQDPFIRTAVGETEVRLHVQNLNFNEARLFAIGLGKRTRLGIVGGKRDAVFSIPWDHSEPIRIEIDILAGPKCTTDVLTVDPGDTLDLQIQSVFERTAGCA